VGKLTMNFKYILTAGFVLSYITGFAEGNNPPPPPGPIPPGLPIDFGIPLLMGLGITIVFTYLYKKDHKKLPD
jgi:hypothetical protein